MTSTPEDLAQRFAEHRVHLRSVAYRMLGSLHEADDAVQETWLRLARTDTADVANLRGWLTTVVGRICLDLLRTRTVRAELPLDTHVPDPVVTPLDDPEHEALLGESVGLAMQVVLDTLAPPERLAFVLHDLFAVPFEDIGGLLGRSTGATKQLASRARGRLKADAPRPTGEPAAQHGVVRAFFEAARAGDFAGLLAVLAPDVQLRTDGGAKRPAASTLVLGAELVAGRAVMFASPAAVVHPVLVNGAAGVVVTVRDKPASVMAFTVTDGLITAITVLVDADRLAGIDLPL